MLKYLVCIFVTLVIVFSAAYVYPAINPGVNFGIRDRELSTIIIEQDELGNITQVKINKNLFKVTVNEDENWVTIITQQKCEPLTMDSFKEVAVEKSV